tara:strand:- start:400 stop:1050 length:651 start_codon:yes stop_codon:yes gene_type:complete
MNIIDTSSNSKISYSSNLIKNVPLFEIKLLNYQVPVEDFTDVIFQSVASVENFKNFEICIGKNIFSMGDSTKKALAVKDIVSKCPPIPGSSGLTRLLGKEIQKKRFLIIKGKDGLSDIENFINAQGSYCKKIICYERNEFDTYNLVKNKFDSAEAVIFTSVFSAQIFFNNIYKSDRKISFFCISKRIKEQIYIMGYEAKIIDYFSDNLDYEIEKSI